MAQFDASSLREFSVKTSEGELTFSKNEQTVAPLPLTTERHHPNQAQAHSSQEAFIETTPQASTPTEAAPAQISEGDLVESPLVGVAYLASGPDQPAFVSVGDSVSKGQTLMIIEAMKVMNEVPAPCDGVITEILVSNEDVIEFGQGLVRIK